MISLTEQDKMLSYIEQIESENRELKLTVKSIMIKLKPIYPLTRIKENDLNTNLSFGDMSNNLTEIWYIIHNILEGSEAK